MIRKYLTACLAVALATAALGGCSSGGTSDENSPSPSPSVTQTQTPLEQARAALLTADEIPVPPPSNTVEIPSSHSAQGDQVSAPWPQFMICSSIAQADEGSPIVVEPGAAAGAWAFGVADTAPQEGEGYSQIDQYAIVYSDEAAAAAAVQRAKDLDCDAAIKAWDYTELEWTVATGPVPESVDGFRTTGTFTIPSEDSTQDSVSTVMRAGNTVHYMRMSESSGGGRDGLLDQDYVEELITAAADNLAG